MVILVRDRPSVHYFDGDAKFNHFEIQALFDGLSNAIVKSPNVQIGVKKEILPQNGEKFD